MKELANLARIVTSRKLPVASLLDFEAAEPRKEEQFVQLLVADSNVTVLQSMKALYGDNTPKSQDALRKIVSRVQSKLLNHLYFLDHSDERHLVSRRYEMECLDLLHKVTILYSEGEYTLTERLLKKCLVLARGSDFTKYAVQAAELLRNIYVEQRQVGRYQAVAKRLARLQQVLIWEQEGDRICADTRMAMAQTVTVKGSVLSSLPGKIEELEVLHRRVKNFNTFNYLYQLKLAICELRGDYEGMIEVANNAAHRLHIGKINPRRFDRRLNQFVLIYAYLQSRQPLQGLKLADEYAQSFHTTSSNWLYFHEHHWLLAMHASQYERARRLLMMAIESVTFSKLRDAAKQRWELYQAYLDFIMPPPRPTQAQRRQQESLILTLPEYSRDKQGHNVDILVLQILHFLRQRNLEEILSRMESLRKYQQRYLRDPSVLRAQLFMRMLQTVVEKEFDPGAADARAQIYIKKLRAAPMPGGAFADTEIVPYENLWEIVLQVLQDGPPMSAKAK